MHKNGLINRVLLQKGSFNICLWGLVNKLSKTCEDGLLMDDKEIIMKKQLLTLAGVAALSVAICGVSFGATTYVEINNTSVLPSTLSLDKGGLSCSTRIAPGSRFGGKTPGKTDNKQAISSDNLNMFCKNGCSIYFWASASCMQGTSIGELSIPDRYKTAAPLTKATWTPISSPQQNFKIASGSEITLS